MPKRELIDTGTDKRYVRRDEPGRFKESDDVGAFAEAQLAVVPLARHPRQVGLGWPPTRLATVLDFHVAFRQRQRRTGRRELVGAPIRDGSRVCPARVSHISAVSSSPSGPPSWTTMSAASVPSVAVVGGRPSTQWSRRSRGT